MLSPTEFRQRLKNIDCFALDLDGTAYLGNRIFPFTERFIHCLASRRKSYLFITNNSSKAPEDYREKFKNFGLDIPVDLIYTSADATIEFFRKIGLGNKLYLLGSAALIAYFAANGFEHNRDNPDAVVAGFDLDFNYRRMQEATNLLRRGVPFYATHPDFTCPMENGYVLPDCGAICAALTAASGIEPQFLGKPFKPMFDGILRRTGYEARKIAVVGDRLMTDIQIGRQNNLLSILVLSGETDEHMLKKSQLQPDFVVESLATLIELLEMNQP